ncbi:MAG TPA: hypothetical protein VHV28_07740, partial [Solirubrobacteraceae bacterium]|nr:hypothetical protein [Solirubrobacteraceae bacterium]
VARATNGVFGELGVVLRDAAGALAAADLRLAEAAVTGGDGIEGRLDALRHAVLVGGDTVRWAPLRRGSRDQLDRYSRVVTHADLAARTMLVLARNVRVFVRGGDAPHPGLADAIRDLGLAAWELPRQFDEPWRSGDVLRLALGAAGQATAVAARDRRLAVNEIAGQVRSIAIDIVRASEAGETDSSTLGDAPTEELLAALPFPDAAAA